MPRGRHPTGPRVLARSMLLSFRGRELQALRGYARRHKTTPTQLLRAYIRDEVLTGGANSIHAQPEAGRRCITSFRLDQDHIRGLDAYCRKHGISRSDVARHYVRVKIMGLQEE